MAPARRSTGSARVGAIIRYHNKELETEEDLSSTCASVDDKEDGDSDQDSDYQPSSSNSNGGTDEDKTDNEEDGEEEKEGDVEDSSSPESGQVEESLDWKVWNCPKCGVSLTTERGKWQHLKSHPKCRPKMSHPCPECSTTFNTAASLKLHQKIDHRLSDLRKGTCEECGETFLKKSELQKHFKSHNASSSGKGASNFTQTPMQLECLMCFKKFTTAVQLGNHYILQHAKENDQHSYQCPFCPEKSYVGQGSLKEHILVHHLNKKLHSCSVCGKKFARQDNMLKHLKSVHEQAVDQKDDVDNPSDENDDKEKTPFVPEKKCSHHKPTLHLSKRTPGSCPTCGLFCLECCYVFATKKKFSGHTHDNYCIKCLFKFQNGKLYKCHQLYHTLSSKHGRKCQECLFGFESERKLQHHLRLWHGVANALFCPICGKKFKSRNNLNVHKITHKEPKWTCEICKKAFQTGAHLRRHQANHPPRIVLSPPPEVKVEEDFKIKKETGSYVQEEVKCEHCEKVCPSAAKLKIHMRVHSHVCKICYKSFSRRRDLRLHQYCHQTVKPNQCEKCSKCYLKPQGLTQHMMSQHGFKPMYSCEPCGLPFSSKQALDSHIENRSCEQRKISRKKELNRRVEAARKKRREEYGLDNNSSDDE